MANSILHDEHLLLGAVMGEGADERTCPLRYPDEGESSNTSLSDLTGLGSRLMSGVGSMSFSSAAFAGRLLSIGETSAEAVLTGDGALASGALLARTGDAEYACWDLCGRGEVLFSWLSFLVGISQQGVPAFPDITIEDASEALVPLLLWGPDATNVLSDYLGTQEPPAPGSVVNLMLDSIGCLVARPQLDDQPCYLVLVPPRYARVLWRSFLSFSSVSPLGTEGLLKRISQAIPALASACGASGRVEVSRGELEECGLLRDEPTFVGARGLS